MGSDASSQALGPGLHGSICPVHEFESQPPPHLWTSEAFVSEIRLQVGFWGFISHVCPYWGTYLLASVTLQSQLSGGDTKSKAGPPRDPL